MKVIPFPGTHAQSKRLTIEVLDTVDEKLTMGEFSVTCPHCTHCNQFDAKTTIFKSLEFFCGGCGYAIKVSNPALKTKLLTRNFKDV